MKQLVLIFIFFVSVVRSQNLVPNWSFETYTICPSTGNEAPSPWTMPTSGSSDYYNACSGSFNVPNYSGGYQLAKDGVGYEGIWLLNGFGASYREYVQVKLNSLLNNGTCYYVEFYANLADNVRYSTNNVGASFSSIQYSTTGTGFAVINPPSTITRFSNKIIKDTARWTQVSGIYSALGTEQFVTIGNFKDNINTDTLTIKPGAYSGAYYFIDAVSVYSINPIGILPWTYRDTTVNFGDSVYIGNYLGGTFNSNWYLQGAGFINSGSGIYVKPAVTSNYIVQFTLCGVPRADTLKVTVNYVGIQELGVRSWELVVSPNPNNGLLTIEILNKEFILQESELRIVTVLGQEVKKEKLLNKKQALNISELNNGIYYLQLFQNDKLMLTKKIIKQ